jgi:hypothetical protein
MVAFKVLPLGSYAPMPVPSPTFKTILELVLWNGFVEWFCGMVLWNGFVEWFSELPLYYS